MQTAWNLSDADGNRAIRSYELGPVVHYQDLVECLPYDEAVYMLQVNGTQLERMLWRILREEAFEGNDGILTVPTEWKIICPAGSRSLKL